MTSIQNNRNDEEDDFRPLLASYQNDERAATAASNKKRARSYLDDGHQMCPTCKGTGKVDKSTKINLYVKNVCLHFLNNQYFSP